LPSDMRGVVNRIASIATMCPTDQRGMRDNMVKSP
jgi:hypothetical protein